MTLLDTFVDNHGQIYNEAALQVAIAEAIEENPVVMSWCDGCGTRLTVLFTLPTIVGIVPGLNRAERWLYVAVEGFSTYGFAIKPEPLAPDYE